MNRFMHSWHQVVEDILSLYETGDYASVEVACGVAMWTWPDRYGHHASAQSLEVLVNRNATPDQKARFSVARKNILESYKSEAEAIAHIGHARMARSSTGAARVVSKMGSQRTVNSIHTSWCQNATVSCERYAKFIPYHRDNISPGPLLNAEILAAWDSGVSVAEIAQALGFDVDDASLEYVQDLMSRISRQGVGL